jgi:hypothetical protein
MIGKIERKQHEKRKQQNFKIKSFDKTRKISPGGEGLFRGLGKCDAKCQCVPHVVSQMPHPVYNLPTREVIYRNHQIKDHKIMLIHDGVV